jgi:hypothetical protein
MGADDRDRLRALVGLSPADLPNVLRATAAVVLVMALKGCQTLEGAWRIYAGERQGLARRTVLRAAERRLAELAGEEPVSYWPRLIVRASAAEVRARQAEARKTYVF